MDNDRPELTVASGMCRKTGSALLVSKLDRLSRKVSTIATLMEDRRINLQFVLRPMLGLRLHPTGERRTPLCALQPCQDTLDSPCATHQAANPAHALRAPA
ncbi:recombinase family protein [Roseobacter sp. HKCCD9010]|nr:recombinase family protein [Rhodobacterales bacterium HKCCD4356]NNV11471.1 recombinase family protein [Roseobacter sp. HKCCD7357]NNV15655.1 recombinase family protein [Roseobacter sp. HKCCD8768]NNV25115.1 recombinase family protein [Roseobacter sp. HKCCD8192]NNV29372.1 recombinase family protein [Roseobacter sp. HKCCD9061]NNV33645.1 recombinase family protein [Roseobacter sp. HKCCD9073]NNV37895.1 recombinase family protein [Roseobacter sp. HKCCD9054]NNV41852.1 recombinase family protein [